MSRRKILFIGKEARIDAIIEACSGNENYVISEVNNPGLAAKAKLILGSTTNVSKVVEYAREIEPDLMIVGPEEPLAAGLVDEVKKLGIRCVGPTKSLARIESSKSFARQLLSEYNIPGNPEHKIFTSAAGIESYLRRLGEFVIKPDGLTGGKGVQVYGDHLKSVEDALEYCSRLFAERQSAIVIEERLDGEEFTLQSFCDGKHVAHMVPVQDHKRAFNDDKGPNTGGMGSYTCEDHKLPFLTDGALNEARAINEAVAAALCDKLQEEYKGILYGGFMMTGDGLRLIEYNARFGDPEAMNVLPLLQTDFVQLCDAIVDGTLDRIEPKFYARATVCKYIVPAGYPDNPVKGELIDLSEVPKPNDKFKIYYASVEKSDTGLRLTSSRAVAFVGIGENLSEAEQIAEEAASRVKGPVFHRSDIGSAALIQKRLQHMNATRKKRERLAVA